MSVAVTDGRDVLLERAADIATLDGILRAVRSSSEGRLVLVGGEAGVGKTALLRAFCETLTAPIRILWGVCEPLRTPRPFGGFVDVAEATGGELEELVSAAARPHEVAGALLRELRREQPTVLMLEDVHWADEATLDVLAMLAARIESVPALALATYRDDERDRSGQLRLVFAELVRRPDRLKVRPLSQAAVAELAGPHRVDAEELYVRTGGNPFFVVEVLAASSEQIPETVRDAVLARAARLSPPARRLLEAVAVVPGQVDLWLLEALANGLVDKLEECLGSGVLEAVGAQVAFRHELARLAIEDAISPDRRIALHRAALAALTAHGSDPARLAYHADAAGEAEPVLLWAPRAGERAASSGAHREAAEQYSRALRFADRLPLGRRAELLQRRADECWVICQYDEAIVAQEAVLECQRALGDRLGEGNSMRLLSRLLFFSGRGSEGDPLALEAVELLEQLPAGHELAMAYGNVSQRRNVLDDHEEAVIWGNRALELAERLDDTEALVYALTDVGSAELQSDASAGQLKLERALLLAKQHNLEQYVGRGFTILAFGCLRQRKFELAGRDLESGLDYCSERGLDASRLYLLACRARLELEIGRWDEATRSAALVVRDPRNAWVPRSGALVVLGLVRARRGDPEASAALEQAEALVTAPGELHGIASVAAARAEAAWLAGDHAAVPRITDAALALALDRGARWVVGELAYWRWQSGVRDELPVAIATEPYGLSIAGDWAKAAEQWRRIGSPYEAALALAESDDQLAVREAINELRALGARPAAAILSRRLRTRGVHGVPRGPRPTTRANPAGLTTRELEVLALLADGLRDREIAKQLFLSERTVGHHVSAILRKLSVRTRAEASVKAVEEGLARRI